MRSISDHLREIWYSGGPFIGDEGKGHSRVTVEPDWALRKTRNAGNYQKVPVRYFQTAANDQTEIEIPNVTRVDWERSVDSDAATAEIALGNQWHYINGQVGLFDDERIAAVLGEPGYFSFDHGVTAESAARWAHETNEWEGIIIPNALLRTYQGYGGFEDGIPMDIPDALEAGYLMLTGLWLIDEIRLTADAEITLSCRDMSKLALEQFCFPPIVPKSEFPLVYCRWSNREGANPQVLYGNALPPFSGTYDRSDVTTYRASSDDTDGSNDLILGHRPAQALDLESQTFWLSRGEDDADAVKWYEFNVGEEINYFAYQTEDIPFSTNQDIYVSLATPFGWVDVGLGDAPGGGPPYVVRMNTSAGGGTHQFSSFYAPTYVRVTVTNLAATPWPETDGGDEYARAAISQFEVGKVVANLPSKQINALALAPDDEGYFLVGSDGGVFSFGPQAYFQGSSGGGGTDFPWVGIASTDTGRGYWTVRNTGEVFAFGDAVHYGDILDLGFTFTTIIDIERNNQGNGYWLLGTGGTVYAFGNANNQGNGSGGKTWWDIARRKTFSGQYWLMAADGTVEAFGGAPHYGDSTTVTMEGFAKGIDSTPTGLGYYIVTHTGAVYTFGDAVYAGGANTLNPPLEDDISDIRAVADGGYILSGEDGGVFNFGGSFFWGSLPDSHDWQDRVPGNYRDYADIVRDLLLWTGWWLYDPNYPASKRARVYGNIESTGIYAESCLEEEEFDKKSIMEVLRFLAEIVGYTIYVDEEGGFHWHSVNIWTPGNWSNETGLRLNYIPEIDERLNLMDYQVLYSDDTVRSPIIISSNNPSADLKDTITTEFRPETDDMLRGMSRPLMFTNESFIDHTEQQLMAELIAAHLHAAKRKASITCAWNPEIQIDDQVRIFERVTSESYIHYVRAVSVSHDLIEGEINMSLTTHWLGSNEVDWIFNIGIRGISPIPEI